MARRFRLFGKKRGDRRTGSSRLGSFGEAVFFAVFLLLGAIGFWMLLTGLILPEWQANRHFVENTCTVISKQLGESEADGHTLYRPEINVRYQVAGETFDVATYDVNYRHTLSREKADEILAQFKVGQVYRCWYDPRSPDSVVLALGYSWWMWLLLILPASFVVIGGVGTVLALLRTGASAERRSALARRAAHLDLFDDREQRGIDFPTVPRKQTVTDSPGIELAYRLPTDATPGWTLAGVVLICLLWNGIVVWLLVQNLAGHFIGRHDWLMTACLVPFFAVGLGILYFTGRQLLLITGAGATRVEISAHPLYPGEAYEVFFSQTGWMKSRSLEISLVCDETATYREGTNTRSEKVRVYEEHVYQCPKVDIESDMAFEDTCKIIVPDEAMHSFQAGHNEIKWQLVVRGNIAQWPNYERRFPVVVFPPALPTGPR